MTEIMQATSALFTMAVLSQFLVDGVKVVLPDLTKKYLTPTRCSLIISVLLAFAFKLDLFAALGCATTWDHFARLLTGIAISAGADPLHNLFAKLREWREPA